MRKVQTTSEGKCIKYIHRNICNELLQIDRVVDYSLFYISFMYKTRHTQFFLEEIYIFFLSWLFYFIHVGVHFTHIEWYYNCTFWVFKIYVFLFLLNTKKKKLLKCKNISCKFNLLLFNKIVFCNFLMYLCLFIIYRHDRTEPWLVGRYYLFIILN